MKNSEVIDTIIRRLGNRRSSPQLREAVTQELRIFIDMKERDMKEPPYFLEKVWETTVLGPTITFPSDFLKELEENLIVLTDPSGQTYELTKRIPDEVRALMAGQAPQRPLIYGILGNKLYFGPSADLTYNISVPYGRKSELFIDNTNEATDWLAEATNAVMLSVQHTFAIDILQDVEMAARVQPRMSEAWKMFDDYCNSRKYSNLTISAGDEG